MSKIIYTIIENQCILLKVFHYTNIFRGKSIYGIPLPISGISVCNVIHESPILVALCINQAHLNTCSAELIEP